MEAGSRRLEKRGHGFVVIVNVCAALPLALSALLLSGWKPGLHESGGVSKTMLDSYSRLSFLLSRYQIHFV